MEKFKILIIVLVTHTALKANSDPLAKFYKKANQAVLQESKMKEMEQLSLGRVSMDLLFLLHPKMKDYNFHVDSFFKELPERLSMPVEFYLKDRQKKYKEFEVKVLSKKRIMMKEVEDIKHKLNLLRQKYVQSNNELLGMQLNSKHRNKKYQQIEREYWASRVKLEEEIIKKRNQFKQWLSDNNRELFLTRLDRDQKLDDITKEVKDIVQIVANKKNINLVINRNAKTLGAGSNLLQLQDRPFLFDNNQALQKFFNNEFHFDYKEAGSPSDFIQAFNSYLKHYGSIRATFANAYQQFDTLGKVHDLTIPSLNVLFTRYKFPKQIKLELLRAVRSWQKS